MKRFRAFAALILWISMTVMAASCASTEPVDDGEAVKQLEIEVQPPVRDVQFELEKKTAKKDEIIEGHPGFEATLEYQFDCRSDAWWLFYERMAKLDSDISGLSPELQGFYSKLRGILSRGGRLGQTSRQIILFAGSEDELQIIVKQAITYIDGHTERGIKRAIGRLAEQRQRKDVFSGYIKELEQRGERCYRNLWLNDGVLRSLTSLSADSIEEMLADYHKELAREQLDRTQGVGGERIKAIQKFIKDIERYQEARQEVEQCGRQISVLQESVNEFKSEIRRLERDFNNPESDLHFSPLINNTIAIYEIVTE